MNEQVDEILLVGKAKEEADEKMSLETGGRASKVALGFI